MVKKFKGYRFEPSGFTRNPAIMQAKSILDYIFRWLGIEFLPKDKQAIAGLLDAATAPLVDVTPATAPQEPTDDAQLCGQCGGFTQPTGPCHVCPECGWMSGGCGG